MKIRISYLYEDGVIIFGQGASRAIAESNATRAEYLAERNPADRITVSTSMTDDPSTVPFGVRRAGH